MKDSRLILGGAEESLIFGWMTEVTRGAPLDKACTTCLISETIAATLRNLMCKSILSKCLKYE